jgi:hypothetical protein
MQEAISSREQLKSEEDLARPRGTCTETHYHSHDGNLILLTKSVNTQFTTSMNGRKHVSHSSAYVRDW